MLKFILDMVPPTVTAQEKKVKVVHGRPVFYEPKNVKEARSRLCTSLLPCRPKEPLQGPLRLTVLWLFPKGKSHKQGEWRVTRPDTDNLQKMLKDCMTGVGFWKDDAQVVSESVDKRWSDKSGICINIEEFGSESDAEKEDFEYEPVTHEGYPYQMSDQVYVVSPYAGDTKKNTENAIKYCKYVMSCGKMPVAAHLLYPQMLDDDNPEERCRGLRFGLKLLAECDEVWIFGKRVSSGMQDEIYEAQRLNKPLRYIRVVNDDIRQRIQGSGNGNRLPGGE